MAGVVFESAACLCYRLMPEAPNRTVSSTAICSIVKQAGTMVRKRKAARSTVFILAQPTLPPRGLRRTDKTFLGFLRWGYVRVL